MRLIQVLVLTAVQWQLLPLEATLTLAVVAPNPCVRSNGVN